MKLSLLAPYDVQIHLADYIRQRRKALKLSREALAERSTVPAPTIKRFESTGHISLRQLLLIWVCIDDLKRFDALATLPPKMPTTIEEVLHND